jgi:hypothetical protein
MADWRADPRWQLVHYDAEVFTEGQPRRPTGNAERSADHCWASVFAPNGDLLATWMLVGPSRKEVTEMRRRAALREGRPERTRQ